MAGRSWLHAEGRLRAGWRIALYLLLLIALTITGELATSMLPREPLGWVANLVLTAAAIVAGWIMLVRVDGRPAGALGFPLDRSAAREVAVGLLAGAVLLGAAAALLLATGTAAFAPDEGTAARYAGSLAWTLVYFWVAAALEEALFRGYAFQALVEGVGVWPAVVFSSALFTALHAANPNIDAIAFGNIFLAGVLLALAYLRTRSLWFATALHTGWNWATASLFAFPVSGLTLFDTPLYDAVERGPDWWTGGAFGPEAGLAGTAAILAGCVWILRSRSLREPERMRERRPLVDARLGPDQP